MGTVKPTTRGGLTLEYCFMCMARLNSSTGRAVLKPLVEVNRNATVPLDDQRYTMCDQHAESAVKSGEWSLVEANTRISG